MPLKRRTRVLAGTLALAATTFSFAETVLASVCAPMDRTAMVEMGDPAAPTEMDCVLMRGHGADGGGEDDPHCPLNPAVGPGCSGVASVPASSDDGGPPPYRAVVRSVFDDVRPDLLLSRALFRPPRA
jgi:hypothetical protein